MSRPYWACRQWWRSYWPRIGRCCDGCTIAEITVTVRLAPAVSALAPVRACSRAVNARGSERVWNERVKEQSRRHSARHSIRDLLGTALNGEQIGRRGRVGVSAPLLPIFQGWKRNPVDR